MVRSAFSLVELSIVLVILGLLAGGILTGQSLIRAAELRAIPTEFQAFQIAARTFQDKYRNLPGDMRKATDFFGAAATCPPTSAAPLTTAATCNGDGNGKIEHLSPSANETFTFWQHLANAGLIEGNYTGASASGAYLTNHVIIGENAPESRISNAGWWPYWLGERTVSDAAYIEGVYNNALWFGADVSSNVPYGVVLTPEEMWNIDKKMDDGKAGEGKLVVLEFQNPTCQLLANGSTFTASTTSARTDVVYNLTDKNKRCSLLFRDVF